MSERTKEKLAWWVVNHLPKRVLLYAFCTVHAITGEGPSYEGEYATAYKKWAERHGLK